MNNRIESAYSAQIKRATSRSFVAALKLETLDCQDEEYDWKHDLYSEELAEAEETLYGLRSEEHEAYGKNF